MKFDDQNLEEILLSRGYVKKEELKLYKDKAKTVGVSLVDYLLDENIISEDVIAEIVIEDILLRDKYVSKVDIKKAEEGSKKRHVSVLQYLLEEGFINNSMLGEAIAEWFGVNYADLGSNSPSQEQVLSIPEDIAKKYRSVVFKEEENTIFISTDNPKKEGILNELRNIFLPKNVVLVYSLAEDIDSAFIHYRKPLKTRFTEIIRTQKRVAPEIVEEIFDDALAYHTSDIHFEPQENEVIIRFRVDGILRESGRIPKRYYENILNRIKVQAHLRTDEHFSYQDGAIRYIKNDEVINLRISIVPTLDGEKVVVRLLAEYMHGFSLSDIGLSSENQELFLETAKKPSGMILVVGPTGAGKTTTLYSLLKVLNTPEVNITTIEDPVEYKIVGVNQIQVNPKTNLTFAKGLQVIIRQDPDIILVGEIREEETAEIAVNAALTGHLLLSTFHANDAATAIPRLLDMKVSPFNLASTLELIIAERLVQKICKNCKKEHVSDLEEVESYLSPGQSIKNFNFYKGEGCSECENTGYKGRTAIYEFIKITPEIHDLIIKNPTIREIWELAKKQGARSMFEDGIEKAKNGITTIEELLRVVPPPHSYK